MAALALTVTIPNPSAAEVLALCEGLVAVARVQMRRDHRRWPSLREAHVRYERTHAWQSPADLLRSKRGDCKELAVYECARLRELGYPVTLRLTRVANIWHVLVRLPNGKLFDPSAELGMRGDR